MNHAQHTTMQWGIYKGSTLLCLNELNDDYGYDKCSCAATVELQKGDTVFVRRDHGYSNDDQVIYGGAYVSFMGFLANA
jgi:hypothetical protein